MAGINCVALFIVSQEIEIGAADVTVAFLTLKDHNQERVGVTLPKVLPEYPKESAFPDIPQERYEELVKEARKFKAGETYLIEMGLYGLLCVAQLFDTMQVGGGLQEIWLSACRHGDRSEREEGGVRHSGHHELDR
uniref:Uncharacterized protein n=1 Tax=Chromera velia CCMP2878 TaxID=1169474 RepID=A0A0G4G3P5_9ALVE|eukprot:Cvel_20133.t1-p1 / transcript=Cvel_20133.t1 / gene=Cvel_20133 / organism=Chromera_velia_CCMP2878 / gene_product=hypothetical protein / transcript_product=hypothetical protein / location=Cvel_scaffold1785:35616-36020(-) / protein_length=135 / sequence_SO=supercontig / SO=protein_coding / is_pseudo=false